MQINVPESRSGHGDGLAELALHQPALPMLLFSEQIAEELNEFFKQEDWETYLPDAAFLLS